MNCPILVRSLDSTPCRTVNVVSVMEMAPVCDAVAPGMAANAGVVCHPRRKGIETSPTILPSQQTGTLKLIH